MKRLFKSSWVFVLAASLLGGCIVRERVVLRDQAPPCRGGIWVEGHYGPYGHWHPGHWQCPG